jgi:phosphotransacetylase
LLKPILIKESGLNAGGFITHFGLMELRGYHKLLAMSDSAVIPYPSFEDKVQILRNCTASLSMLGYDKPVVGALCAVETVNPKMPETLDAQRLQELSVEGVFGAGTVVGPISFDLATRKESAAIKGFSSPYAGEVDMLLVPNMVTGNVMSKIWNGEDRNILAGCLIGADVPIALTSRSASMNEKLHSILLCTLLSGRK